MNPKFIVLRDGYRVSEDMHSKMEDAEQEAEFWRKVIRSWPDGTKVVVKKIGGDR